MGQERLIRATISKSLAWDETQETSIDRITAIGFAARNNEIGDAMLRVDALDAHSLHKVILLLIRRLNQKHHIARGFGQKIAFAVLHEYMRPNCIHCGGKGNVYRKSSIVTVCSHCNGSGLHRYSDSDRASLIGGNINQRAYEDAMGYVRDAVRAIVVNSDKRLDA